MRRASNPPHIFASADAAYQCMVTFSKDQVKPLLPFLPSYIVECILSSFAALMFSGKLHSCCWCWSKEIGHEIVGSETGTVIKLEQLENMKILLGNMKNSHQEHSFSLIKCNKNVSNMNMRT